MYKTVIKSVNPVTNIRLVPRPVETVADGNAHEILENKLMDNSGLYQRWKEVQALHRTEVESARAEGNAEGRNQGLNEGRAEVTQTAAALQKAVSNLMNEADKFFSEAESFLVKLALKVAEKIVRKTVESEEDLAVELVRHALRWVKESEKVIVRVHPSHMDVIESGGSGGNGSESTLKFIGDDKVDKGGCILETEWGVVDSRITTQIDQIYQKLIAGAELGVGEVGA